MSNPSNDLEIVETYDSSSFFSAEVGIWVSRKVYIVNSFEGTTSDFFIITSASITFIPGMRSERHIVEKLGALRLSMAGRM